MIWFTILLFLSLSFSLSRTHPPTHTSIYNTPFWFSYFDCFIFPENGISKPGNKIKPLYTDFLVVLGKIWKLIGQVIRLQNDVFLEHFYINFSHCRLQIGPVFRELISTYLKIQFYPIITQWSCWSWFFLWLSIPPVCFQTPWDCIKRIVYNWYQSYLLCFLHF